MLGIALQSMPNGLFETAFSVALVAGALLFIGGLVSFAVFAYRSVKGDGMKDPEEVRPDHDDDELTKGDSDDEWDFY